MINLELQKLIEYKNWADEIYLDYCEQLSDENYKFGIEGYENSIEKILGHMYEVSLAWYHFVVDQKFNEGPNLEKMSKDQIIVGIRDYNSKIYDLTDKFDITKIYQIQWNVNHKIVETTAKNIIFNFVTHNAYHRGQLAIYLRLLGIETITETDFNPYIYEKGQE